MLVIKNNKRNIVDNRLDTKKIVNGNLNNNFSINVFNLFQICKIYMNLNL